MIQRKPFTGNHIDLEKTLTLIIRVGLILGLFVWCFLILHPFMMIALWALVIAVSVFPAYEWLAVRMGNRFKISAVLITILILLLIIVPFFLLGDTLYEGIITLKSIVDGGQLTIPPPAESVRSWPIIGNYLFQTWSSATQSLEPLFNQFKPQIMDLLVWFLGFSRNLGMGFLMFLASIIISGIFLVWSKQGGTFFHEVMVKLAGNHGHEFADNAVGTIRNVARGILGVAFIQSTLAGIGFLIAGVPGAGLWALISLFFGIVQIGVMPVCLVVVVYMFFYAPTFTAIGLMIWCILISPLDNILKPILLGRGSKSPMLVIFLGAIGGFLLSGIIGLFVGAVVLSLGYNLFLNWLRGAKEGKEGIDQCNKTNQPA